MSDFHIVQIGCGVVGKAYVDAYNSVGCKVTVIEASEKLIEKYKPEMNIYHIFDNLDDITNVDFVMISVCTPLKGNKLDMNYLLSTISNVATILKSSPDASVVIRSTVTPTMTKKYKRSLEKLTKQKVDVLFQPEFLRAVSAEDDALNPWAVVIGADNDYNVKKFYELYSRFLSDDKIFPLSIEEAEILKIYHNCFNAAKISFFNQCDLLTKAINKKHRTKMDINSMTKVLAHTCEGLLNPKYGTKAGHAYYGTCLPKDSAELAHLEKKYKLKVPLFSSVVKVNNEVKKTDKKEYLNGDHHISFEKMNSDKKRKFDNKKKFNDRRSKKRRKLQVA